jgi:DNA recombination protein RmuC
MNEIVLRWGSLVATAGELTVALAALVLLVLGLLVAVRAGARGRAAGAEREIETRLAEVAKLQSEMTGRMQTMAEIFGTRQSDLARALTERLDGLTHRLGHSMVETTRSTHESLAKLHERMGVIDRAQSTLSDLADQVFELNAILSDKQTRGAFGQGRMEAIVQDALPASAYAFQATLSSGVRPDCLIHLPNGAPPLAIDAKFPLEGWTAWEEAGSPEAERQAGAAFRKDVLRHVEDIRSKYLIPGETQDMALMFVPSESVFATLCESFPDIVQKAHRARVVIVSPSLLVLSIQVVQSVLRDWRMREQAHLIRAEVGHLLDDVARIHDRVIKLQMHYSQTGKDLGDIVATSEKLTRRATRLGSVDFQTDDGDAGDLIPIPLGAGRAAV